MSSPPSSGRPHLAAVPLAPLENRDEPSRLPNPLSSLVGREREIAAFGALLRDPTVRLVTLTGPGGVGKTRLALRLAADLAGEGRFADGAAFVDLTTVRDPDHVGSAIAQTLGVRGVGQEPAETVLKSVLRAKALLLVLDNFEQVSQAGPQVTNLLQACPGLTVIVTSRSLLNVSGEHVAPVPPLSLPGGEGGRRPGGKERKMTLPRSPSTSLPLDSEAVRLFVERTREVNPAFVFSEANAETVTEVVRRLDGLPLAIELAAARGALFSPAALLARLERRLPQLTGGPRDQPARLRTMRDAIAWSYDLLAPEEQRIFRALSVFAGGATLEAVETVSNETGERRDVAATVESLVRQSMLFLVAPPAGDGIDGPPRVAMLETLREYAQEQLAASGEEPEVRHRHAAWCLEFAERHELADLLPDGDRVLAVLAAEHANLRAALALLEEAGEPDLFLRLAATLGRFWVGQALPAEGRDWLERALARDDAAAAGTSGARAKALVHLGWMEVYLWRLREAESHLKEGLAGCRDQGLALHTALALHVLATVALLRGDHDRGAARVEEAIAAARAVEDPRFSGIMTGWALTNGAFIARARGDVGLAADDLEEALRLLRDTGYLMGTIMALVDRGDLARDQGDHPRALGLYRETLALGRENPGMRVVTDAVEAVGIVAVALGQAEPGARLLAAAEARREQTGVRFRVAENQAALEQAIATCRANLGDAAFAAAWAAGRTLRLDQAVAEALGFEAAMPQRPSSDLTPREREILRLLAAGQANTVIARALFISTRTVENHVAHILGKLGVTTRADAVESAIAQGLVDPSPNPTP